MVVDVPPGNVVVEAYAVTDDGAERRLIGMTKVQVYADTLMIADVYTGSEDGVVFDEACLSPCGG
jgi:hypothetical protein